MGGHTCTVDQHGAAMGLVAELQALDEVSRDVLGHLDSEAALLSVVNAAVKLVDADMAGILLIDGDVVRMRACVGHRTVATAHLEVCGGQGVAGRVLAQRQVVRVDDYLADPTISKDFLPIAHEEGTRSAMGAPMVARAEMVGVLMVWRRRTSVFAAADERTLTNLANMATIAIVNARLFETERAAVVRLEEANSQLQASNELLSRSAAVHDELTELVLTGHGISALVPMVAAQTGGLVAVLDPDLSTLGASPGSEAMRFRATRHLRKHPEPSTTVCIPPNRDWGRWLLMRAVAAGEDVLGWLTVSLDHQPDAMDRVIVEQAAIVCALNITRDQAVLEGRARVSADFVWDLLEGNLCDEAEALVRARWLGRRLPEQVRVLLVSITGDRTTTPSGQSVGSVDGHRSSTVRAAERAACDALHDERHDGVLTALRYGLLALILPGDPDPDAARAVAGAVVAALRASDPGRDLAVGVSACLPWTADLTRCHSQARSALSAAPLVVQGADPVAVFDELGVIRFLLAPGDRGDLRGFTDEVLGAVVAYDARHGTELVATVDAYLASDCSLQRTAETLFVHPKTVRYRLHRVQELAGLDLSSQGTRFDAQFAITILRALSVAEDGTPTAPSHPGHKPGHKEAAHGQVG